MKLLAATWGLDLPGANVYLLQPGDRPRKTLIRRRLWAGLTLIFIAGLVCWLTGAGFKTDPPFRPGDFRDEPVLLDSFSEPAVACAILRQEAERLLLLQREDSTEEQARAARGVGGGELVARGETGQTTGTLSALGNRSGPQTAALQSLTALDAQFREVRLRLTRGLLLVYLEQHLWNEFVDRYVQLVAEAPGQSDVVVYAPTALACAQKCGRTDEVVDALQHVVRFHPEERTAAELKDALVNWKPESTPGLEVSSR